MEAIEDVIVESAVAVEPLIGSGWAVVINDIVIEIICLDGVFSFIDDSW